MSSTNPVEEPTAGDRRGGPSRRTFLIAAGGMVATGAAGAYVARPILYSRIIPVHDPSGPTGDLTDAELSAVLALVDVLIVERYHPGPDRARWIVQSATRSEPGVLDAYRAAARYLEDRALRRGGVGFAELAAADRVAVLRRLLWEYPAGRPGNRRNALTSKAELVLTGRSAAQLRQLVVRDLLVRFYLEAQAAVIGYENVPGVPGDPREYTRAPARPAV